MAKSSFVKDLEKIKKKADRLLKKTTDPIRMKRLGKLTIEQIRKRTRLQGKGVDKAMGTAKPLKKVSQKYADWRKKNKKKIHRKAARGVDSNLTLTGQMIDSLDIVRYHDGNLLIGHSNKLAEDKTKWQKIMGRTYMYISRSEFKAVMKKFDDIIRKIVAQSR